MLRLRHAAVEKNSCRETRRGIGEGDGGAGPAVSQGSLAGLGAESVRDGRRVMGISVKHDAQSEVNDLTKRGVQLSLPGRSHHFLLGAEGEKITGQQFFIKKCKLSGRPNQSCAGAHAGFPLDPLAGPSLPDGNGRAVKFQFSEARRLKQIFFQIVRPGLAGVPLDPLSEKPPPAGRIIGRLAWGKFANFWSELGEKMQNLVRGPAQIRLGNAQSGLVRENLFQSEGAGMGSGQFWEGRRQRVWPQGWTGFQKTENADGRDGLPGGKPGHGRPGIGHIAPGDLFFPAALASRETVTGPKIFPESLLEMGAGPRKVRHAAREECRGARGEGPRGSPRRNFSARLRSPDSQSRRPAGW